MTGLMNWWQQRRCLKRKMIPRTRWRRRRRRRSNQKRRRAWVNVSNGGVGGVFTGPGNWRQKRQSQPKDSATTTEASEEDEEYTKRPRDWRRWLRQRGINDGPVGYTMTTEALSGEDDTKYFNKDNGGVGGGYTTRPRDWRRQRRQQRLDDGPDGLLTTTECQFYLLWRR